ncbi:MAG TPA: AAA family ATPase, partial [Kofleriaceae bacterium]|nr:AAA family ATPase [Kofleriaceae bacterium]
MRAVWRRCTIGPSFVIAADEETFGYQDGGEQLAEYAERFGLLFDRLRIIRAHMPEAAAVVPQYVKDQLMSGAAEELEGLNHRLRELDLRLALRTELAEQLGVQLALELLRQRFGLIQLDIEILSMLFALESGGAFNPYDAKSSITERVEPEVAFFMALLGGGERYEAERARARFLPDAPLIEAGLVLLSGGATDSPVLYKRMRLAERTLEFLSGSLEPPPSLLGTIATFSATPAGSSAFLVEDKALVGRIARAVASPEQMVILRGATGVGRKSMAGAAAREIGRSLLAIDLSRISLEPNELSRTLATLFREARMQQAVLVLDRADEFADREGQHVLWPELTDLLAQSQLQIAVVCENLPPWLARVKRVLVEIGIPFPSEEIQHRLWVRHLPPTLKLAPDLSIDQIVHTYSLSCASIIATTDELTRTDHIHARGGVVDNATLVDIVRKRLAHQLGSLADVVRTTLEWKDVVLSDDIYDRVIEFLNFARHRQTVMREMGFGRKLAYGRGLSALFSGPPGTGKTMICTLLSKELGMELYRIDLSQVVNKYIGETEKNLGKVFDEAARGQVMLLFDEADSIFAKRT